MIRRNQSGSLINKARYSNASTNSARGSFFRQSSTISDYEIENQADSFGEEEKEFFDVADYKTVIAFLLIHVTNYLLLNYFISCKKRKFKYF